ncbi:MAG: M48 family metallopeptidase [Ectothiorhodospiraceae bacterium]|nr:M48 family metallopeptidase [Ectothiorhodospiraceae bacterium]MCH8503667.1 M48 family metallopeptidase [Ectothiorhodospiraceae bacterium]
MSGRQRTLRLDTGEHGYTVRYSRRRTLGLYVFPGGRIEARAPHGTALHEIERFIRQRQDWLLQALARAPSAPERPAFSDGAEHPLLGRPVRLELEKGGPQRASLLDEGRLRLLVRQPDDTAAVKRVYLDWLRGYARRVYQERMALLLPGIADGVEMPPLTVRAMRSQWGSCSSRGRVNLNLWLVRAPLPCVDYVVAHELCHLREFNHGPAFHRLMDRAVPDWRRDRALLNQHQARWGLAGD